MTLCPGCGEWLPHAWGIQCIPVTGPGYWGADPGGPDYVVPVDWLIDLAGRDQ